MPAKNLKKLLSTSVMLAALASVPHRALAQTPAVEQGNGGEQASSSAEESAVDIVVTGFRDRSSAGAAKLDLPLVDTPQSITVVSDEVFESLGLREFYQVSSYTPGIQAVANFGDQPRILSRGFQIAQQNGIKIDGINLGENLALDPVVFERLEFVKGANAISYGQNSPGGFFNFVLKQPTRKFAAEAQAEIGTNNYVRVEGDVGAPLDAAGRFAVRIGGAHQRSEEGHDFQRDRRSVAFGIFRAELTPTTTVKLKGIYQQSSNVWEVGLPSSIRYNGAVPEYYFPSISEGRTFTGQPWNRLATDAYVVQASIEQNLSDRWAIGVYSGYVNSDTFVREADMCCEQFDSPRAPYNAATDDHGYFGFSFDELARATNVEARISGNFDLFGRRADLVVFGEYNETKFTYQQRPTQELGRFTISAPNYDFPNPFATLPNENDYSFAARTRINSVAGNFRYELTDALSFMVGGRYDQWNYLEVQQFRDDITQPFSDEQKNAKRNKFSPRGALVMKLNDQIRGYYSYSQSLSFATGGVCPFDENGNLIGGQSAIPPEVAKQNELGIKGEFSGGKLLVTANVFDIEVGGREIRSNTCFDADGFPVNASTAGGRARSSGVELEIVGNLTRNINVVGGYAYTKANITRSDDPSVIRKGFANVPRHQLALFARYDALEGLLKGFGAGAGFSYVGRRPVDNSRTFDYGDYLLFDAALYYNINERISLALNVRNLTDAKILESASSNPNSSFVLRPPRSVVMSVRSKF